MVLDPLGHGCVTFSEDALHEATWFLETFWCPVAVLVQRALWTCF